MTMSDPENSRVATSTRILCPLCGASYQTLSELMPRALGIAMFASCTRCGEFFSVGQYWRKTQEVRK